MKPPVVLLLLALLGSAQAGPSSPSTFPPAATRQDFTGQGTYHRQGLLREQQRAIAGSRQAGEKPLVRQDRLLTRLWRTLFPSTKPSATHPRP